MGGIGCGCGLGHTGEGEKMIEPWKGCFSPETEESIKRVLKMGEELKKETKGEKMNIKIVNVEKVKLEKGDTLIFKLDKELIKVKLEEYFLGIKEVFPDQDIVLLPKG